MIQDSKNIKYRYEYKYLITEQQLKILQSRLNNVMELDPNVNRSGKNQGIYTIRSLYFDDINNSCFYENENGTDPREKFRIRIYNNNTDMIRLELKQKVSGKCHKASCRITQEQCYKLINGIPIPFNKDHPPVLKKMLLQMQTKLLRPAVIVEYDRIPYIYNMGNVRVTMDMNIRSSNRVREFMNENLPMRLIMEKNQQILEVKWDELLPDFIRYLLSLDDLVWTAFSKYYLCRRFSLGVTTEQFKYNYVANSHLLNY
jgi:hypothetical protein